MAKRPAPCGTSTVSARDACGPCPSVSDEGLFARGVVDPGPPRARVLGGWRHPRRPAVLGGCRAEPREAGRPGAVAGLMPRARTARPPPPRAARAGQGRRPQRRARPGAPAPRAPRQPRAPRGPLRATRRASRAPVRRTPARPSRSPAQCRGSPRACGRGTSRPRPSMCPTSCGLPRTPCPWARPLGRRQRPNRRQRPDAPGRASCDARRRHLRRIGGSPWSAQARSRWAPAGRSRPSWRPRPGQSRTPRQTRQWAASLPRSGRAR
mmetsp:Transcript_97761/g.276675  ORF Transcript_97761/g.276675 Transcript_97761/m.276675 type:complete len:266 (-) Transcript_97761:1502-2299(-)